MKSLRTVFRYVSKYPKLIATYFTFNVLANLFAVISLGLLSPFLWLIFKEDNTLNIGAKSSSFFEKANPVNFVKAELYDLLQKVGS